MAEFLFHSNNSEIGPLVPVSAQSIGMTNKDNTEEHFFYGFSHSNDVTYFKAQVNQLFHTPPPFPIHLTKDVVIGTFKSDKSPTLGQ